MSLTALRILLLTMLSVVIDLQEKTGNEKMKIEGGTDQKATVLEKQHHVRMFAVPDRIPD